MSVQYGMANGENDEWTTECEECGPVRLCDEDGCCMMCGIDLFHDDDGNPRDTAAGHLLDGAA